MSLGLADLEAMTHRLDQVHRPSTPRSIRWRCLAFFLVLLSSWGAGGVAQSGAEQTRIPATKRNCKVVSDCRICENKKDTACGATGRRVQLRCDDFSKEANATDLPLSQVQDKLDQAMFEFVYRSCGEPVEPGSLTLIIFEAANLMVLCVAGWVVQSRKRQHYMNFDRARRGIGRRLNV